MNIYDTANNLAHELRSSQEYKEYKRLKEEVKADLEIKEKIDKFEKMRYELQLASIQCGNQDEQKTSEIQNLYIELIQNESVRKYFDAELKFNVILTDINKIIGEAVEDVLK